MSNRILIILFLILLTVLLVPVPRYNKYDADCLPCPPADNCPPCPRKGWEFRKPILLQLISTSKRQQVSEVGETHLPQSVDFEDGCDKLEEQINALLEQANHCQKDSDCKVRVSSCPFGGCYNLVNKNEILPVVEKGVERYKKSGCQQCAQKCGLDAYPKPEEIECWNGKCIDIRYE